MYTFFIKWISIMNIFLAKAKKKNKKNVLVASCPWRMMGKYYSESKVWQCFGNTWGRIRQIRKILLWSWKGRTSLDCEMSSSPNILWEILDRFACKALSTISESNILGLLNLAWSSRFFQPERNKFFGCFCSLSTLIGYLMSKMFYTY